MHRLLVAIEKAGNNYSADSPDLPGCAATGQTKETAEQHMQEAMGMHLDSLSNDNLPIPDAPASAERWRQSLNFPQSCRST